MEPSQNPVTEAGHPEKLPSPYKGFSLRQRLLPVILLAFAAGLTICFFGPFDIYTANADEFRFPLVSFIWYNLLTALAVAAILTAVLLPLRGRVFDVVYAILFWLTLMLFIQGNYLNFGITALSGDGMGDDGKDIGALILNTAIWLIVGAGCVSAVLFLRPAMREWIPTVGVIAMVTVIGMQTIPFAINSLAGDIWSRNTSMTIHGGESKNQFLSYKNMEKVSSKKNIIYFVIDRFDMIYYEEHAKKECPELFEELDGFVYFDDMVSLYPRTYPAIPYLLTGREHDFHDNRIDYLQDSYRDSEFLNTLKENNYNINIYTDIYYGYHGIPEMQNYICNDSSADTFSIQNKGSLSLNMTQISLFRYLPHAAKELAGNVSTADFSKYFVYNSEHPQYTSDMRDAYSYLNKHPMTTFDNANNFTFIHLAGCHLPVPYDESFEKADGEERNDPTNAMKQSFTIINLYLRQLKELGLYQDATIVITGDHGWHGGSDSDLPIRRPQVTALFFKESGSAGTPLVTNAAPVEQGDIIPTILQSESIDHADFGKSLFEFTEGEDRVRRFNFQSLQYTNGEINYEVAWYHITGRARDFENWELVSRGDYVGNIYQ